MPFGQSLEKIRKERGMTQAQLAAKLDVNQSLIAKWESGKVQPRTATLERLADVFDLEVEELLAGEYGQVSANLRTLDPKLVELLGEVHRLAQPDREALRRILEAMLTRTKIQEAMAG
jgi:transcriptional regulator with XRE-family HTH domain